MKHLASSLGLIFLSVTKPSRDDLPEMDNQVKAFEAREKPVRGDRKEARRLNALGLQQFGAREFDAAAQTFASAVAADGSDQEIINNAGFAGGGPLGPVREVSFPRVEYCADASQCMDQPRDALRKAG